MAKKAAAPKADLKAEMIARAEPVATEEVTQEPASAGPQAEVVEAEATQAPQVDPVKTEPQPEQPKTQVPAKTAISSNESGYLQAETLEGRYRVADAMFKGKMVPKSYESAAQVFAAMEYAIQLGLRPMVALQKIAIVNGSPALWGDLPLALALDKGLLPWHKCFLIDKDHKEICFKNKNLDVEPWGAVMQGIRKGHEERGEQERFFTKPMAEKAGLPKKEKTPWGQGYDWRMMMYRAQQQFIKDITPDAIYGIPMAEHDFNVNPTEGGQVFRDVSPSNGKQNEDAAKSMADLLAKERKKDAGNKTQPSDSGRSGEPAAATA